MRAVYVATDDAGRHKIGVTGNIRLRAYHLSRDLGRPVRMVYDQTTSGDPEAIETTAHWTLADRHLGGEWFDVPEHAAIAAVKDATSRVLAGHRPASKLVVSERYGLPALLQSRVSASLKPGEAMAQFIREAVERELERREAGK